MLAVVGHREKSVAFECEDSHCALVIPVPTDLGTHECRSGLEESKGWLCALYQLALEVVVCPVVPMPRSFQLSSCFGFLAIAFELNQFENCSPRRLEGSRCDFFARQPVATPCPQRGESRLLFLVLFRSRYLLKLLRARWRVRCQCWRGVVFCCERFCSLMCFRSFEAPSDAPIVATHPLQSRCNPRLSMRVDG